MCEAEKISPAVERLLENFRARTKSEVRPNRGKAMTERLHRPTVEKLLKRMEALLGEKTEALKAAMVKDVELMTDPEMMGSTGALGSRRLHNRVIAAAEIETLGVVIADLHIAWDASEE